MFRFAADETLSTEFREHRRFDLDRQRSFFDSRSLKEIVFTAQPQSAARVLAGACGWAVNDSFNNSAVTHLGTRLCLTAWFR
jgi:hypothetical protein